MPQITFTQHLRPNGQKKSTLIEVPDEIAKQANQLAEWDVSLHSEVLRTGEVSLTAEDDTINETIAIEVVPNGPEVIDAVHRLIRSAYTTKYSKE